MDAIDYSLLGLFLAGAVLLIRNNITLQVRLAFINSGGCWDGTYDALPDYYPMVFHPRYWTLWTLDGWRSWVARQTKASAA